MNNEKIAWLAGLWEGEGTFGLYTFNGQWFDKKRNKNRREFKLKPFIALTNTDISLINESAKILDENEIILHLVMQKSKGDNLKVKRKELKDIYRLTTFKLSLIKKTIELLLPYLIGKKPQAELLLRFVNSRLKNWKSGINSYTEEEKLLEQEMRILKSESSETIRQTLKK